MQTDHAPKVVIETESLLLRELTVDDLDSLAAMYGDPEVMRYFAGGTRSRRDTSAEIEWANECYVEWGFGLWAMVLKQTDGLIGRAGLLRKEIDLRKETEIAYLLGRSYWGRGLATEAAGAIWAYTRDQLAVRRMIALIAHGNTASQQVARKIGMLYERDVVRHGTPTMLFAVEA